MDSIKWDIEFQRTRKTSTCLLLGETLLQTLLENQEKNLTREAIALRCQQLNLLFLGVANLELSAAFRQFQSWLAEGVPEGLHYLLREPQLRQDPRRLLPTAKVCLVFALPYGDAEARPLPRVARYAGIRDYHSLLRKKLRQLVSPWSSSFAFRICVDSAPLLERALAARTAEGFIGKNSCYIHPRHGSYLLLGEVLTDASLPWDSRPTLPVTFHQKEKGGCGGCQECQIYCPTGALDAAYRITPSLCLSYWTIEHRGPIPEEFWPFLAEYYFGCDICQQVCPYNAKPFAPLPSPWKVNYPTLEKIAVMDQSFFEKHFWGTPLARAKRAGLQRNAIIALTVTQHPELESILSEAAVDAEPLVIETLLQVRNYRRRLMDNGVVKP